jgi:hypothetical protein
MKSWRASRRVRRRGAFLLALLLVAGCRTTTNHPGSGRPPGELDIPRARIFAGLGYRGYDDSWAPFDDQLAFLMTGQHHWPDAPVGVEWGFGFASEDAKVDGTRLLNSSVDLSVGPTRTFALDDSGRTFLNLGLGGQVSFAYQETASYPYDSDRDEWFAGYAHASLFWRAGWNWDIGVDVRWVKGGDAELAGTRLDGEYFQVLFGTGFAW